MKKIIIAVICLVLIVGGVAVYMYSSMVIQMNNTDSTYWEKDINKIEARYEVNEEVDIVFIGSSSIRKWESLESDFSEYQILNHGFGGSKVADSTYYFDRLITPFNPKVIVFFAGTNNIHGMTKMSDKAEKVFEDVRVFYEKSSHVLPDTPVYYISISPTKSRWNVWLEADKANNLIKEYTETQENFTFIDTTDDLLKNGYPNETLYQSDGLHLNEEGYALWAEIIKPIVTEAIK